MLKRQRPQDISSRSTPTPTPTQAGINNSLRIALISCLATFIATSFYGFSSTQVQLHSQISHQDRLEALERCKSHRVKPGVETRTSSDRLHLEYDRTDSIIITNARIFSGREHGGIFTGELLMEGGVIQAVGERVPHRGRGVRIVDARGAWITPGLGSNELDSKKGPVLPYLRSIDGFHTFDERILRAISHGVTSAQVATGKANLIGGQAFVLKLRKTFDGSPSSMVIDEKNGWKYLIQSCNEATRQYGNRMDGMWALRKAYNEARKVMKLQDAFCERAEAGIFDSEHPDDFQWNTLIDVLRGKVKVFNFCGEAVDLDNMVRLSREFRSDISAFLSASEAWVAPGLTRKIFSRETYRGSPLAPRILMDNNASVIMLSDDTSGGGHIIDEARKAYYYGLTEREALQSITSAPAKALGLSHRIGVLDDGLDADLVLWDSHPLQPGASPIQVWIDGIPQRGTPSLNETIQSQIRDDKWQRTPLQPSFDKERQLALAFEGLPPHTTNLVAGKITFMNVTQVWDRKKDGDIEKIFPVRSGSGRGLVVIEDGAITCVGEFKVCAYKSRDSSHTVDLNGGSISPGLMTFGSRLGLQEFVNEPSADDGQLFNSFERDVPRVLQDVGGMVRAVDGLMFGTRHAINAYRAGVTSATSSLVRPIQLEGNSKGDSTVIWGLSTTFRTGAAHALESGAIMQEVTALHIRLGRASGQGVSVSQQLAGLRRLLYGWESRDTDTGKWFRQAAEGVIPLIVEVNSADIMASLISLKADIDDRIGGAMRMVFSGASEAPLLAEEIGQARIGVVLTRVRPSYTEWEGRRILPGPPLSNETTLGVLLKQGVSVAIGVEHPQFASNTPFDLREIVSELGDETDERTAHRLATRNLEQLLGVKGMGEEKADLVAFDQGSITESGSKAVAVISASRGVVDLF